MHVDGVVRGDIVVARLSIGETGHVEGATQAEIVEAMVAKGLTLQQIIISGGAAQSPLVRQIIADATGLEVAVAETSEPVLLGSAMLIAHDMDTRPQWTPWLAGMVVAPEFRGRGIGAALVERVTK